MSKVKDLYRPGRIKGKKGHQIHIMKTSPNWMKDKMKGGKQK